MMNVYVDGSPVPLAAYLQVVAESLLGVAHSLTCPCQKLPSRNGNRAMRPQYSTNPVQHREP